MTSITLHIPTSTLSTPLARTLTHLHPALLLSTFLLSFSSLVADPVATSTALLGPLALIQGFYCLLCLPPRGGDTPGSVHPHGKERRKGHATSNPQNVILRRIVVRLPSLSSPLDKTNETPSQLFSPSRSLLSSLPYRYTSFSSASVRHSSRIYLTRSFCPCISRYLARRHSSTSMAWVGKRGVDSCRLAARGARGTPRG